MVLGADLRLPIHDILERASVSNTEAWNQNQTWEETWSLGSRGMSSWRGMLLKRGPSSARPPSVRMPHSRAMDSAVCTLSPVTIRTRMPALLQVATASGTSFLTGSCSVGLAAQQSADQWWLLQLTASVACWNSIQSRRLEIFGRALAWRYLAGSTCTASGATGLRSARTQPSKGNRRRTGYLP